MGRDDGPKNDMSRVGLFQEMSYVTVQDPYVPASKFNFNEAASKGKQMLPGPAKERVTGLQDGYFDKKFPRVFESEAYSDPIGTRRRQRQKEAKKNITTKPFITFHGEKKPEGLGSYFGTFAGKQDFFSSKTREGKPYEHPKPNIKTNPPKKGTGYGYPHVGLSKYPEYKGDKYDAMSSKQAEEYKKANLHAPFKSGVFQKAYFDKNPYLTEKDGPVYREKKRSNSETNVKIFKPSSPPKTMTNLDGFLTKYPTHMDDPFKTPSQIQPVKRIVNNTGKLFTPQQGPKSKRQTSVIDYNVRVKVNPNNYRQAHSFSTYNLTSISAN